MPRLKRYRRFVAILPRNILKDQSSSIGTGSELWLVCMNAARFSRRSSGRFFGWQAKRAFAKQSSLLSTYLNRTKSLNPSTCLGPVKQAGSFNRASSVLCSCEKFQEIVYVG